MEIFISDSLNSSRQRMTINQVENLHPSLSMNCDKVMFTEGDYELGGSDVFFQNVDGTDKKEISNRLNEYGAIPVFSKSNKLIAYCSWYLRDNKITKPQIIVYSPETGERLEISNKDYENWRPFFSPDEKLVVYISKREKHYQLVLYDLISKSETQLMDSSYDIWDPAFSEDGNRIIFSANPTRNWDLFEYDLIAKKVVQITQSKGDEWDPFYTSDSTIIFSGSFGPFRCIYKRNLDQRY